MKTLTDEQAAAAPSRETDQQTAAEDHDELQRVEAAVACLSDNQQEVLRLKFQGGLSYREISEITELSISNVGYLLHTALQKVREQLASQT